MIKDEKNMTPEEKKQYLEELRKQLDPEILQKMAGHLGGGETSAALASMDSSAMSDISESAATSRASSQFSTPSDRMKDRRAMQFQERVAQRKREMEIQEISPQKIDNKIDSQGLILSTTEIWTRIVDNQLKTLGIVDTRYFYEFQSLLRYLIDCYNKKCLERNIVAIALKDATGFVHSWKRLVEDQNAENKLHFLKNVPFIIIVESQKQIPENHWNITDQDRIISLTEDVDINQEKICRLLLSTNEDNQ